MPIATKTLLTAEDFERQYADVEFCELERGEVIQLTAAGWRLTRIAFWVAYHLGQWAERSGLGRVVTGDMGLITSRGPDTVRGVDVVYFSYQRLPQGHEPQGFADVPPDLAIEIVGAGQGWKKMHEKAAEYQRMGVDRVWIIDPKKRTLHAFTADDEPCRYADGDQLHDEVILPGFRCLVQQFFKD